MSTWVTLTEDDALSGMSAKERTAFATASVEASVPDRLLPILANFSNEIRGYVQTHAPAAVSATPGTIPPEFVDRAVDYIRFKLLLTGPGYQPGDGRKLAYEKAEAYFMKVAEGKILPAKADDAAAPDVPQAKPSGVEVVSGPGSRTGRARMDGI